MNKEAVKEFFNAWSLYDRVLDLNYMFHDEIYCDVANLIKKRYAARPFSILDLGCGSARHFAAALQGCTVSCYTGYDLSDIALEEAHRNLASLGCSLDFKQEDFFEGLKTGEGKADLIFSSYALHHLMSSDKERFFQLAHQRLAEQGMLLLIDVAREENEDRATYLDNYCVGFSPNGKVFLNPLWTRFSSTFVKMIPGNQRRLSCDGGEGRFSAGCGREPVSLASRMEF